MVHIVLFEPEIPQNTGNIARTCAATGAHLHLIEPLGFQIDDRKLRRAGLDYWHLLPIDRHASWDEFWRRHGGRGAFFYLSTKAKQRYDQADYTAWEDIYLVFGPETRGLPDWLLARGAQDNYRIPMRPEARSLNLSNSVAIVVYEALRQRGFERLLVEGPSPCEKKGM